jgi:hypothetical protein
VIRTLFAVGGDVLDRPSTAVVGEQAWIDRGLAIALEEALGIGWPHQIVADAAHDEHQVPLLGRQDRLVPVHQPQLLVVVDEHVPGVQVGMAQHLRER